MNFRLDELNPEMQEQALRQIAKRVARNVDDIGRNVRTAKEPKYHNQPDERGSVKFDSKKEARRYDELYQREMAGEIRDLKLQADFTLVEAYTKPNGERVHATRYRADFSYERKTAPDAQGQEHWVKVVEDVKSRGTRTKDYIIKKKFMHAKYGITIQEV